MSRRRFDIKLEAEIWDSLAGLFNGSSVLEVDVELNYLPHLLVRDHVSWLAHYYCKSGLLRTRLVLITCRLYQKAANKTISEVLCTEATNLVIAVLTMLTL